jgi:very-short-patch-repair endonuclease
MAGFRPFSRPASTFGASVGALPHTAPVTDPFLGSEARAAGAVTRHQLRSRFVAIHPDVYVAAGTDLTATMRAHAAWLWSRRRGVIAGHSASALHGAKWVNDRAPAQLLYQHRRPPPGIRTWLDRVADDEIQLVDGMATTTPARTAFDLACRNPVGKAVAAIDALARATRLDVAAAEAIVERYRGHRNIRRARNALRLVDAGAESPRETWLRLLIIEAGYPRPQTQIPVYGDYGELVAVLDMGWEEIKVAAEYEGDHHRTNRRQFNRDIARLDALTDLGWIVVRVTAEDVRGGILRRVAAAWSRRTCHQGEKIA